MSAWLSVVVNGRTVRFQIVPYLPTTANLILSAAGCEPLRDWSLEREPATDGTRAFWTGEDEVPVEDGDAFRAVKL